MGCGYRNGRCRGRAGISRNYAAIFGFSRGNHRRRGRRKVKFWASKAILAVFIRRSWAVSISEIADLYDGGNRVWANEVVCCAARLRVGQGCRFRRGRIGGLFFNLGLQLVLEIIRCALELGHELADLARHLG